MPTPRSEYLTASIPAKSKVKDISGQRFGRLIVVSRSGFSSDGSVTWLCACDCGGTKVVSGCNLRKGTTTSCGCYQKECRLNDLTGRHFGRLVVLGRSGRNARGEITWLCACDCGKTKAVVGYSLTMGMTNSCGSHPKGRSIRDLQGQRFGRLVAVSLAYVSSRKTAMWSCVCDCGKTVVVLGTHLTNGHTTSCKCLQLEMFARLTTRHGQARRSGYSGAYRSWTDMIKRCTNPNTEFWKNYGGRGITVCPKWQQFEGFFEDVGPRPPKLSLDRKNVDGDYQKSNCRWTNSIVQGRNQRVRVDNRTGVRGVTIANRNRYKAGLKVGGKRIHLGYFPMSPAGLEAAKAARLLAEDLYWGDNR
jgi:hypothetical protein